MKKGLLYHPKFDRLTATEQLLLDEDVDLIKKAVRVSPKNNDNKAVSRNAHAKSYGFVHGRFLPNKNLPGEISRYFPNSANVIIRYSHPHFKMGTGTGEYPIYGCGLKIFGEGSTQDINFTFVNFPIFLTNSVSKFLKVHIEANKFLIGRSKSIFNGFTTLPSLASSALDVLFDKDFIRIVGAMIRFFDIGKNLILGYTFSAIGCYRLGDKVVKYRLKPASGKKFPDNANVNQAEELHKYFLANDFAYELQVQFGADEKKTPVNDLLKEWSEKHAKFVTIGRVLLPRQNINYYRNSLHDALSYDPFENIDELKPVGRIQKIRQKIYEASVSTRHALGQKRNKYSAI